jgi:hypothetical protein
MVVGRFPFSHMASLYRQAAVMFISLKPTDYPHLTAHRRTCDTHS